MSNEYYDNTGFPATSSSGSSASMRNELQAIEQGFNKLPVLAGNSGKIVKINATADGMEVSVVISEDGINCTISGGLIVTGGVGPDSNSLHTVPNVTADVFALLDATQTLLNKTINLASNTLTGNKSQFNAALSDADFLFSDDTTVGKTNAANSWTAEQTFKETKDTVHTITDGAAFEIDPANGSIQVVTLGANRSPKATNFADGQTVLLGIDDGTARTITWTDSTLNPTWVKVGGTAGPPTLALTGYTWVLLWKVGSTIYGVEVGSQ